MAPLSSQQRAWQLETILHRQLIYVFGLSQTIARWHSPGIIWPTERRVVALTCFRFTISTNVPSKSFVCSLVIFSDLHEQRLKKLRELLKVLSQDDWMYPSADKLIGLKWTFGGCRSAWAADLTVACRFNAIIGIAGMEHEDDHLIHSGPHQKAKSCAGCHLTGGHADPRKFCKLAVGSGLKSSFRLTQYLGIVAVEQQQYPWV